MSLDSLSDFLHLLEEKKLLKKISHPVKCKLEITEISRRFLETNGPAILFENVYLDNGEKSKYPVVTNLYASKERIALGLGLESVEDLKKLGQLLAFLKAPEPPSSFKELYGMMPIAKKILAMKYKTIKNAPCQEIVIENPDLTILPIQTCWPLDISPLITWSIVVTKGPTDNKVDNYNLGVYRAQLVGKNKLIMRWLKMRGGANHHNRWKEKFGSTDLPAAIVIGSSPAIALAATMPLPENISEYSFAGLLSGKSQQLVQCKSIDLKVPACSEIVLEGYVSLSEYIPEGPFGDHTGYYNEVEEFPVFNVKTITMRKNAKYLSTYTGKPPDEPSILGEALNEIFVPILKQQFPEIVDFWLPPEGCSYRIAVVSIKKSYPGEAKRICMGISSFLKQFMYTKFIIVVDSDINIRDWKEVIWAISTRSDPARDVTIIDNMPIDYLDFASPISGMGGKMWIDATNKIYPETSRKWGEKIEMDQSIISEIDKIWHSIL
jgi:4-hydroxy-3-polyprenylbenzoate decarboxylase